MTHSILSHADNVGSIYLAEITWQCHDMPPDLVPHLNLCISGAAERGEQLVGVQECAAQRVPSPPPEDLEPRGWSASPAG